MLASIRKTADVIKIRQTEKKCLVQRFVEVHCIQEMILTRKNFGNRITHNNVRSVATTLELYRIIAGTRSLV